MPFEFRNLDEETRRFMIEEIESARRNDNLYFSKRSNSAGITSWPVLVLEAAQSFNEHWLAYQLSAFKEVLMGVGASFPLAIALLPIRTYLFALRNTWSDEREGR